MATEVSKTVNFRDLSDIDQKIVTEHHSLIKELFQLIQFTPESSPCTIYKEEILYFLEMYKSVFSGSGGTWQISTAEVPDQKLLQFRAPYQKLFQENAYICISKFPQKPKFTPDEKTLTSNAFLEKRILSEYNWMYRINLIKRETYLKSLKDRAVEEFQKKIEVSFLILINELEIVYDEEEFRTKHIEIQNTSVEEFKSQISSDEGILTISFLESELKKETTLNKLSEKTKRRFLNAFENAAEKVSNTLSRCRKQCNDKAQSFFDDVEVIFNISGIPEIYKSQIQLKLEASVNDAFADIEVQSIVKYENCEKLLSLFDAQGVTCKPRKPEIDPNQKESPQKTILKTLPPAPGRDELTTKTVDDQVFSKTEAHSKKSETTSTPLDIVTKFSFGDKTNNMFLFGSGTSTIKQIPAYPEAAKQGFSFGTDCSKNAAEKPVGYLPQIKPTSGRIGPPAFTFNKNFGFDPFRNKIQQPLNTLESLVTNFNKITFGESEEEKQRDKQNRQFVFSYAQPPVKPVERDLNPLCIHLQDSQIQIGMMVNGEVQVLKDEFGNSLIPAVVAYSKEGQLLWGSKVDTCDIFQLLQYIWWLLKPTQDDNNFFPDEISFQGKSLKVTKEFLLAFIFRKIKLQVENELRGLCKMALIVVPLHFTSVQRKQVKHSAEIAGFSYNRLVDEPSAIACEYSVNYNYKGHLLVLSESSNDISASCMFISTDPSKSGRDYIKCDSCNHTGCLDKENNQDGTQELAIRNLCLETSKRFRNKFGSDVELKFCIICKADSKWIPILETVGQEYGKGNVRMYNSAIAGAALLGNSPSKHNLISYSSLYDLVIESDKTGIAQHFDSKNTLFSLGFKHIEIDGNRASIYQVGIDKKRIPVLSICAENVTNYEVVGFRVHITCEGILNVNLFSRRSAFSSDAKKIYTKDINLSTPNISEQDVLQYKVNLVCFILNQV